MELLISLLILVIVEVVVFYIIDLLGLPAPIGQIAKLIIGLVALIYILQATLPAMKNIKLGHNAQYEDTIKLT